MSRMKIRAHTKWNPNLSDKPLIKRVREHPRHTVKMRLRLSVSRSEKGAIGHHHSIAGRL